MVVDKLPSNGTALRANKGKDANDFRKAPHNRLEEFRDSSSHQDEGAHGEITCEQESGEVLDRNVAEMLLEPHKHEGNLSVKELGTR
jgi:hypothetical protein